MPSRRPEDDRDLIRALGELKQSRLHEPSRQAMVAALELGRQLTPKPTVGRWLVSLLFDSSTEPLPEGVRRGSMEGRRLLFELRWADAELGQLDVRIEPPARDGTISVVGQALVDDPVGAITVEIEGSTQRIELDETGAFITRVERNAGQLVLTLELQGHPPLRLDAIELW